MNRYAKLQRRIRAEQENFLEDVVQQAGFKVCTDVSRPPEGRSVYIEYFNDIQQNTNFMLIPCFAVPNYMSVKKDSPTYIERSAQEKDAVRTKLFEVLPKEGLSVTSSDPFTDGVKVYTKV